MPFLDTSDVLTETVYAEILEGMFQTFKENLALPFSLFYFETKANNS